MRIRNLIVASVAALMTLISCDQAADLGLPSIKVDGDGTIAFEAAGGDQQVTLTATRDWIAEYDAEWLILSPEGGEASLEAQTVTVTAKANTGMDRSADVKFTIGMSSKIVTVTQKGPGGSTEALIVYANDFDKEEAVKGSSWTTYLDKFQGWHNEKGTGINTVTYGYQKMTARTNSANGSAGQHSLYTELGASGTNYLWFGTAPTHFAVKNITLPEGKTDYTLSFGTERYEYSEGTTVDNTFSWNEFSVYVSVDAQKWVKLSCDFAGGSLPVGKWDLASSIFTVPAGTAKLHVYFTSTKGSAYAIDDLKLVQASAAGTVLNFANGESFTVADSTTGEGSGDNEDNVPAGTGEGTSASPYSASKAWHVASALNSSETKPGVYVQGTVKSIKEVSTDFGNATYYITDEDGIVSFYVYRGKYLNEQKFTSSDQIKVGDNVIVYGDLMNYQGDSPQLGKDNFIVKLNDLEGTAPGTAPESNGEKTVAGFIETADAENFYTLTGTVSNFNSQYFSFDLTDETGTIYVYSVNSASKSQWTGTVSNGSVVTIIGKYLWYENAEDAAKNKHEVIDAWIVTGTQGEDAGDEGDDEVSFPDAAWSYVFASGDLGEEKSPAEQVTLNGVEWKFYMEGSTYLGFDTNASYLRGLQMGKSKEPASSITLSTEGITGTIKKIIVNTSGASGTDATLTVKVGGTAFGSPVNTTQTSTDYTFEGSASGKIELNWTLTKAAVYIKHIAVYTE